MIREFQVISKIGSGTFGEVFKVRRTIDNNLYVMKKIPLDKDNRAEAIQEVHLLAGLNCQYVLKFYESFIENACLYIITELCDLGDLSSLIARQMGRQLPESYIWTLFIQICLGLEHLHSKKIMHRDLKTKNIFLVSSENVKIGDLGIAKNLDSRSFAHNTVGTLLYLSPELANAQPYDFKSDIWALGCILYELLTLRHPFEGSSQSGILNRINHGNYISVSGDYSPELKNILSSCLARDIERRSTIKELISMSTFRDMVRTLGIHVPPTSILNTPQAVYRSIDQNQCDSRANDKKCTRNKPRKSSVDYTEKKINVLRISNKASTRAENRKKKL